MPLTESQAQGINDAMSILKIFDKKSQGPRELVLDVESTGLFVADGHRIVEVAIVEMVGKKPTGRELHVYINPDRHIPEEVVKIHGIDDGKVKDAPKFAAIAKQIRDFIGDDQVIITCRTTNDYTLDINMMNMEFQKAGVKEVPEQQWTNVRRWSEQMFGDKAATLDKVLDRYGVSRKERDDNGHGALLDARLLGAIYPSLSTDWDKHKAATPAAAAPAKPKDNSPKA